MQRALRIVIAGRTHRWTTTPTQRIADLASWAIKVASTALSQRLDTSPSLRMTDRSIGASERPAVGFINRKTAPMIASLIRSALIIGDAPACAAYPLVADPTARTFTIF